MTDSTRLGPHDVPDNYREEKIACLMSRNALIRRLLAITAVNSKSLNKAIHFT